MAQPGLPPHQPFERVGVGRSGLGDDFVKVALVILAEGDLVRLGQRHHVVFLSGHTRCFEQFPFAEEGGDIGR
jgi:hypothetical protein